MVDKLFSDITKERNKKYDQSYSFHNEEYKKAKKQKEADERIKLLNENSVFEQIVNKKKVIKYKRYVLDIESLIKKDNGKYQMDLGAKDKIIIGIYDGDKYSVFYDFKEVLKYIFRNGKDNIVYAHNGGKYDYLYLMDACLRDKCFITEIFNLNGTLLFTLQHKEKQIVFRDSLKLLPVGLDNLCKSYNTNVKKIKMDYSKDYFQEEIEYYLKNDVLSLFEILSIFENEIKAILKKEDFCIDNYFSIASLSFKILHEFYLHGETRNFLSIEEEEFIRESYHGGRVELYKFQGHNLKYYDVNSLYPMVMWYNYFPYGKHFEKTGGECLECLKNGLLGVIECEVKYPYSKICLLSYRTEKGTIYPYGNIKGIFTSPEIIEALNEGAEVIFIRGIFWDKKKKLFSEFVNDFYKMKLENTGAKREIAKLFLNSSYGRFGMKRTRSEIISECEAIKEGLNIKDYTILGEGELDRGDFYSKEVTSYRDRRTNPTYASFITAYARIYLYKFMKHIGEDHIFYCDTDSIVTDKDLENNYVDPKKLGYFKEEHSNVMEAYFVSPKLYGLRIKDKYDEKIFNKLKERYSIKKDGENMIYDIIKAKGVFVDFVAKMSLERFKHICQNKEFQVSGKRMVSFKQKFNRLDFKYSESFVNIDETLKDISCIYDKRITKGNVTEPIELKD